MRLNFELLITIPRDLEDDEAGTSVNLCNFCEYATQNAYITRRTSWCPGGKEHIYPKCLVVLSNFYRKLK